MSIEDRIRELAESLPEEYEQLIIAQLPLFRKATREAVDAWIWYMLDRMHAEAHKVLVESLPTEDVIADGQRVANAMQVLNEKSVTDTDAWVKFFQGLVEIAIRKYVIEED